MTVSGHKYPRVSASVGWVDGASVGFAVGLRDGADEDGSELLGLLLGSLDEGTDDDG